MSTEIATPEPIVDSIEPPAPESSAPPVAPVVEQSTPDDTAAAAEQLGVPLGNAQSVEDVLASLIENQNAFYDSLESDDDIDPSAAPDATNELEALRTQLAERDSQIAALNQHVEAQLQQQAAELDRRLSAEIDSWASPHFGVGRNRVLGQVQNTAAFRQRLSKYINGLAAAGEPIESIEAIARQARQFADPTFRADAKPPAAQVAPLGTPGVGRGGSKIGGEQPRSIHHALQMNSTF